MSNNNQDNNLLDQDTSFNLGLYLKNKRLSLNFTIEQISQDTRIQKSYLQALEDNDFEKLPERTYSLGYLRTYANYLGLSNIDELLVILDSSYDFVIPKYSNMINPLDNKDIFSPSLNTNKVEINIPVAEEKKIALVKNTAIQKENKIDIQENVIIKPATIKPKSVNTAKKTTKLDNNDDIEELSTYKFNMSNALLIPVSIVVVLFILFSIYFFNVYNQPKKINELENIRNLELQKELMNFSEQETNSIDENLLNEPLNSNGVNFYSTKQDKTNQNNNNTQATNTPKILSVNNKNINTIPAEGSFETAILLFEENVWINVHDNVNQDLIYLDKIFNAKETINIPLISNISIHIGNYKGVKLIIDDKLLSLKPSNKNSLVIYNLPMNKEYLFEKYGY